MYTFVVLRHYLDMPIKHFIIPVYMHSK